MEIKEKIPDLLSDLICKDLLGLLDQEQKVYLEQLCKKYKVSEEDREKILIQFEKKDNFDAGIAYRKFRHRAGTGNRFYRLSIAAAIFLCFGIGLYYMMQVRDRNAMPVMAEKAITPGGSKAILTLADGKKVNLESLEQDWEEMDGTKIRTNAGEVVYQENGDTTSVLYNTIDIPQGGEFRLVLSDGTKVWLNAESQLKYPVCFHGDKRKVFLKGEAYFEVTRNEAQPFIVSASKGDIRVLGTSFNVRDYADEGKLITVLESGRVNYCTRQGQEIALSPGYMIEDQGNGNIRPQKVNTLIYTGWKDGKFIFENASVEEIMSTLERWYDISVFYANDRVRNLHFTGDLERYANFNKILGFMEAGGDVKFEINGNTIVVREK